MNLYNRFTAYLKRILYHKSYLFMLFLIMAITVVYKILPEKSKTSNIVAAIYYEDNNEYTRELTEELSSINSVYTFKYTASKDELINLVKSKKAECGFVFPTYFFEDYIAGNVEKNPILIYTIPSTTLSASIGESIFSNIIEVTAADILVNTVNNPELNDEMTEKLQSYRNGSKIFTLSSSVSGQFNYENQIYKIKLPVYEVIIIFLIISSLLGLLLFQYDTEKNMYISLKKREYFCAKLLAIVTAIIPILLSGIIACQITYGFGKQIVYCILTATISIVCTIILSFICKKSSSLTKLLPLITFISTIVIFATNLL